MIVFSLGGSLINPGAIDIKYLRRFRDFILARREKFIVVCGGGCLAREYMCAARSLSSFNPDVVGIQATLLNAHLLRHAFGERQVFCEPRKVSFKKVLLAAGWRPGCSTDLDAVLWAEKNSVGTVYNLTNIDYVYDKDPKRFKSATPIKSISWHDYLKLVGKWVSGLHCPFDPIAARRAQKADVRVVVLNGRNLNNLACAVDGVGFKGTVIS